MKKNGRLIIFTFVLVALATACKFSFGPDLDWSGFSPVIAIALFSGFIIRQKDMSFILPLMALIVSDAVIQFFYTQGMFPYSGFYEGQWKNYALLLLSTLVGWGLKGRSHTSLFVGAVAAPTLYFLASNLVVWQSTTEAAYPKTFSGLMTCYEAALPFYRNSVVATVVFLPLILVAYNYLTNRKLALTLAEPERNVTGK